MTDLPWTCYCAFGADSVLALRGLEGVFMPLFLSRDRIADYVVRNLIGVDEDHGVSPSARRSRTAIPSCLSDGTPPPRMIPDSRLKTPRAGQGPHQRRALLPVVVSAAEYVRRQKPSLNLSETSSAASPCWSLCQRGDLQIVSTAIQCSRYLFGFLYAPIRMRLIVEF